MKPACLAFVFALSLSANFASAQADTTFTYQGELQENGNPAIGLHDFDFSLWNAVSGGFLIGTVSHVGIPVIDGKFTVDLDFGDSAFNNSDRWLEIVVNGNLLAPRQPITRVPYAIQTRGIFVDNNLTVRIQTALRLYGDAAAAVAEVFLRNSDLEITNYSRPGDILFKVTEQSQAVERLRIKSDGKVGIGTNSPKQRLHNVGDYYGRGHLYLHAFEGDRSDGTAYVMARDDSGTSDIDLRLRTQSNGNVVEAFHIEADGSVGIGTSVPNFLLHVDGTAGKPGGGSWSVASDVRLKKNVSPIDDALGTLLRLRGVTFEYIDPDAIHELSGQRIGMIAQEVEKVVPDWVNVRSDGYKTVTSRGFEALTVEALRELKAENDTQIAKRDRRIESQAKRISNIERENAKLRDVNDSLRTRLDSLEQLVEQLALSSKEQPRCSSSSSFRAGMTSTSSERCRSDCTKMLMCTLAVLTRMLSEPSKE